MAWNLVGADTGNYFLEGDNKGKACTIAIFVFSPLKDHLLIITKDLCGLRASGLL